MTTTAQSRMTFPGEGEMQAAVQGQRDLAALGDPVRDATHSNLR